MLAHDGATRKVLAACAQAGLSTLGYLTKMQLAKLRRPVRKCSWAENVKA